MRKFSRFYRGGERKKKEKKRKKEIEERGKDVVGHGLSNEARPLFASFAMPTH